MHERCQRRSRQLDRGQDLVHFAEHALVAHGVDELAVNESWSIANGSKDWEAEVLAGFLGAIIEQAANAPCGRDRVDGVHDVEDIMRVAAGAEDDEVACHVRAASPFDCAQDRRIASITRSWSSSVIPPNSGSRMTESRAISDLGRCSAPSSAYARSWCVFITPRRVLMFSSRRR